MKKLQRFMLVMVIGVSASVTAQQSFSLQEAKSYGVIHSYKSQTASIEIEKSELKIQQTRAIGLPQVNGKIEFQNFIDLPTSVIPANAFNPQAPADMLVPVQFGTDYTTTASVSATQLIFDGSYIVGLQAAKKYRDFSYAQKDKTELEIKESISKAYLMVLVAQENAEIMEASLEKTQKIYEDMTIYYENKMVEEQEVDQLKVSVSDIKTRINQAKRQLSNAKNMLKYEMGMDLNQEIVLSDSIEQYITSLDLANFQDASMQFSQNLDYQLLSQQRELTSLNVKLEKSKYLPNLAAFFNHQQQNIVNKIDFTTWYPATIWGFQMNIPIWSSGQQSKILKQAKLDLLNVDNQISSLEEGLKLQIMNAQDNLATAKDVFETEKESLELTKKIKANTEYKYQKGLTSSIELTQVQNQFLMKEAQYIQAMFNLINAKVELEKLLNKL